MTACCRPLKVAAAVMNLRHGPHHDFEVRHGDENKTEPWHAFCNQLLS
jgi:hypothetical protein